ncbi:hypothetical protein [Endozoicomonas ascidiicola]|uniref:hypothetical protein n=1 Tax=Endozoicomonas ascidiicola TaxID=1698521 RepID=UPI0008310120|nr:hypothetical protein [Endozoicomonas ascidiicola]
MLGRQVKPEYLVDCLSIIQRVNRKIIIFRNQYGGYLFEQIIKRVVHTEHIYWYQIRFYMPVSAAPVYQAPFDENIEKSCSICKEPFLDDAQIYLQSLTTWQYRSLGVVGVGRCEGPHLMHLECLELKMRDKEGSSIIHCDICQRDIGRVEDVEPYVKEWGGRKNAFHKVLEWVVRITAGDECLNLDNLCSFAHDAEALLGLVGKGGGYRELYAKSQYWIGQEYKRGYEGGIPGFDRELAMDAFYEAENYGWDCEYEIEQLRMLDCRIRLKKLERCLELGSIELIDELRKIVGEYPANEVIVQSYFRMTYLHSLHLLKTGKMSEPVLQHLRTVYSEGFKEVEVLLAKACLLNASEVLENESIVDGKTILQALDDLIFAKGSNDNEIREKARKLDARLPALQSAKFENMLRDSSEKISSMMLDQSTFTTIKERMAIIASCGESHHKLKAGVVANQADVIFEEAEKEREDIRQAMRKLNLQG